MNSEYGSPYLAVCHIHFTSLNTLIVLIAVSLLCHSHLPVSLIFQRALITFLLSFYQPASPVFTQTSHSITVLSRLSIIPHCSRVCRTPVISGGTQCLCHLTSAHRRLSFAVLSFLFLSVSFSFAEPLSIIYALHLSSWICLARSVSHRACGSCSLMVISSLWLVQVFEG